MSASSRESSRPTPHIIQTDNSAEEPSSQSSQTTTRGEALENQKSTGGDGDERGVWRHPWRVYHPPWSQIVNHPYKGSGTTEDPLVIDWLPDGDQENPRSFPERYKWAITMISAIATLAFSMGSSVLSAAINSIEHDFPGGGRMRYIMVTGIYILGFVVGPFIWAPCSEVFGRRDTFNWTFVPFCAFSVGVCLSQNLTTLLIMRFFAGTFGCSCMTNSGAIISDMFDAHRRGLAMGVFAAMPFLGPIVGPIIGGHISQVSNWRWVGSVAAILGAILTLGQILVLPETFAPVILRRRAKKISAATGKVALSQTDIRKPLNTKALFKHQLRVPMQLLFTEPIVLILSFYMSITFSILYMQFTSFPIVFQQHRHWSPGKASLAFIGIGVGSNAALVWVILFVNPNYSKKLSKLGYLPPEERLNSAIAGAILLPIGLFIIAWTCVPVHIHWIWPILGCVPYGAGMVLLFLAVSNYLIDAYLMYAASVLAGGTVLRSTLGVVFPLFTVDIYRAMGPNWASCFLAFLGLIFLPGPILLKIYGRRIRRWTKPGREADDLALRMVRHPVSESPAGKSPDDSTKDVDVEKGDEEKMEDLASTTPDLECVVGELRRSSEDVRRTEKEVPRSLESGQMV